MLACNHTYRQTLSVLVCCLFLAACAEADDPFSPSQIDDLYGEVETTHVTEPVSFTDQPYDFTGDTSIADLLSYVVNDNVWYGFAPEDKYPIQGACDYFGNEVNTASQLPVDIEGIVTLHPRYFVKISFCGEDERYYGAYFIEDSSGGIMVLKDSRIADFTMGDRVKIHVRGLMKYFDTRAVMIHNPEQIVSLGNDIAYEEVDRELTPDDYGVVKRFTGKVSGLPTNQNFNEMCLVSVDDTSEEACNKPCQFHDDCESNDCVFPTSSATVGSCSRDDGFWLASLDREIGQRQPRIIKKGDIIELTGPIENSFGLKFLIARWGQMKFLD